MKKITAAFLIFALCALCGCKGKNNADSEDVSRFIADGETVESGTVVEAEDEPLPTEEELGEYQEIFMRGDILEDNGIAGWVIAVSLKDITVNTYNKITKYILAEETKNTASHLKPGDAVLIYYTADEEDGTKTAYDLSRVRVEDEPLTKEEILKMYGESDQAEAVAEEVGGGEAEGAE